MREIDDTDPRLTRAVARLWDLHRKFNPPGKPSAAPARPEARSEQRPNHLRLVVDNTR